MGSWTSQPNHRRPSVVCPSRDSMFHIERTTVLEVRGHRLSPIRKTSPVKVKRSPSGHDVSLASKPPSRRSHDVRTNSAEHCDVTQSHGVGNPEGRPDVIGSESRRLRRSSQRHDITDYQSVRESHGVKNAGGNQDVVGGNHHGASNGITATGEHLPIKPVRSKEKMVSESQQITDDSASDVGRQDDTNDCVSDDISVDFSDVSALPGVSAPDASKAAAERLRLIISKLTDDKTRSLSTTDIITNIDYAANVLESLYANQTKRLCDGEDDSDELSDVHEAPHVPSQVKEWLSLTFTRSASSLKRLSKEPPKFRSVANAIRVGIMVTRIYRRLSSSIGIHVPVSVLEMLKQLDDWHFDVFSVRELAEDNVLKYVAYEILQKHHILTRFRISSQTLENFLVQLQAGYGKHSNPYHNQLHAADVTQTTHHVITSSKLALWMTDIEVFATLLAAMIHDYEHTGTTNNFHINTSSEMALLYNDKAVLESHHASAAFRMMLQEDSNILACLKKEEYKELRALVIEIVLATDMSLHFAQIKTMKTLLTLPDGMDKCKMISLIVHCADISHPAKPWDLHSQWTSLLVEEFFVQGDREAAMSLAISPLCDRKSTHVPQSQIGFIEFIVEPSFQVMADAIEKVLSPMGAEPKRSADQDGLSESPTLITRKSQDLIESTTKYKIDRHWIDCLLSNKNIWKEQAAKEAEEAKALQEAEEKAKYIESGAVPSATADQSDTVTAGIGVDNNTNQADQPTAITAEVISSKVSTQTDGPADDTGISGTVTDAQQSKEKRRQQKHNRLKDLSSSNSSLDSLRSILNSD